MYAAPRPPGERHGVRRLVPWLLAVLVLAPSAAIRGAEHHFDGLVDLRFVQSDADWVWLDRGLDKSRFSDSDTLILGRALVEYRGRLAKILEAHVSLAAFDTVDKPIEVTEAYLLIQPVPRSTWRLRLKAGAFFPPVSLENTDVAWTSPYNLSTSAINT